MNADNSTLETITIQLTKGQQTIISAIDADLTQHKWTASAIHDIGFRAVRKSPRPERVTILLHRVILERIVGRPLSKTEVTDHIDGNPLNNCRENLRIATNAQNGQNRGKARSNTSGFKGVYWHSRDGKWVAKINAYGKRKHLGGFTTPEAAYEAYCTAARELHGEFANTGVK